jgi:xanthine dehydrogenase accessory factor
MNTDYILKLREWAQQGFPWAEAILVKAQHSSPLPPGARLAINAKGDMVGAISMGCVENDLRENLLRVLETGQPCIRSYGTPNNALIEVGLTCGGKIDVLLHRQEPDDVRTFILCRDPSQSVLVLIGISAGCLGRQRVVPAAGAPLGSLGSASLDAEAERAASFLKTRGGHACVKAAGEEILAEFWEPPPQLAIVGASPIAMTLCHIATLVGFEVTIVDPRKVYARAELFPDAKRVVHEWPEEGLQQAGLDAPWYVAVVAHDEKLDVPALSAALRANCRYIGLLGSRTTQSKRREALRKLGFTEEQLKRIRGPIGMECGALEPAEIAVSILAELIATRRAV